MSSLDELLLTDIKHSSDFMQASGSGDISLVSGLDNVTDALLRRLVTEPGAFIHRPEYGVGIKRFQNAPGTLATKRELATRITKNFESDPRVESVLGVTVINDDYTPEKFTIIVRVKIIGYGERAMTFTPFGELP
jgi:phage baseplate assembly protein W